MININDDNEWLNVIENILYMYLDSEIIKRKFYKIIDYYYYRAYNNFRVKRFGAIAQLEERLHGMEEVVGSTPISSTI